MSIAPWARGLVFGGLNLACGSATDGQFIKRSGNTLVAAAIGTGDLPTSVPWTTSVLGTQQDKTNNTFATASLQLTGMVAGGVYEFGYYLGYSSGSTTPGLKVQLIDNDSVIASSMAAMEIVAAVNNVSRAIGGDIASSLITASVATGIAAKFNVRIYGTLTMGSTGAPYLEWAQATTNATAMSLLAGSYAVYRRIS